MGLFLQPLDPNLSLPLFSAEPREPTGTVLHFLAPVQVSIPSSFRLILRVQFAQFLGTTDSDFFGILDSTKGLQVAIRAPEGSTRFAIRDRGYFQHVPKKKAQLVVRDFFSNLLLFDNEDSSQVCFKQTQKDWSAFATGDR